MRARARLLVVAAVLLWLPAPAVSGSERRPLRAVCDPEADSMSKEWNQWSRQTIPVSRDGPEFEQVEALAAKSPAVVERMLRLGLQACDVTAAQAIGHLRLRALLPDLKDLLDAANVGGGLLRGGGRFAPFRVQVVLAANRLDPATDYAPHLVPLFADRDEGVRISATMGARDFRKAAVSKALLDTIRRDGEYLIRYHAAESLLALGDIYPRAVADHGEMFELLKGPWRKSPTRDDFAKFARAAEMIEALLAAPPPAKDAPAVRPAMIHVVVQEVRPRLVAVGLDAAESPSGTEFALVLFVESTKDFRWLPSRIESKVDPTSVELPLASGAIVVEYRRAAGTAHVRGTVVGTDENVTVLAADAKGGVTTTWRGKLSAKVARGGDLVNTLLGQSAALKQVVRP
jgi:hypothetical protein